MEPKDKVLLESIKKMVFETQSKCGMNQCMGRGMNHYMERPKTKRTKCLTISQTTLGRKMDNYPKRVCMGSQIKIVFGSKEYNMSLRLMVMIEDS